MSRDARPDQLITFARCHHEALAIEYRDLPTATLNQIGAFQLLGGIRDGRPLDTQHFGEQALRDLQCVIVTAILTPILTSWMYKRVQQNRAKAAGIDTTGMSPPEIAAALAAQEA